MANTNDFADFFVPTREKLPTTAEQQDLPEASYSVLEDATSVNIMPIKRLVNVNKRSIILAVIIATVTIIVLALGGYLVHTHLQGPQEALPKTTHQVARAESQSGVDDDLLIEELNMTVRAMQEELRMTREDLRVTRNDLHLTQEELHMSNQTLQQELSTTQEELRMSNIELKVIQDLLDGVMIKQNVSERKVEIISDMITSNNASVTHRVIAFGAHRTDHISTGATTMKFDIVDFVIGSGFSRQSSVFTAPVSGLYFFSAGIRGGGTTSYVYIKINGVEWRLLESDKTSDSISGSGIAQLQVGDTVSVYVNAGEMVSCYYRGSCHFDGYLLHEQI